MKVKRNDPCHCGSGDKFKYCCGKDGHSEVVPFEKKKSIIIKLLIALFLGIIIYGIIMSDRGMELYKCDNPNCKQWHSRPKTSSN